MTFINELKWRGLIQDITPGTEEHLEKGPVKAYIGFDPTGDSLHIGSLVPIILLIHLQKASHKPFALIGGATGMIGDPSGKSAERNLLSLEIIKKNQAGIQKQLAKFLDFDESNENAAVMVNNYDWFEKMNFIDFARDIGKHITVSYMMSKDSVKSRLETGMSFTEFTYQLIQGYDFLHLNKEQGITLQAGGSDQWGNIVTGTELIRRKEQGEALPLLLRLSRKRMVANLAKLNPVMFGLTELKPLLINFINFG
jgi:tyrosyl-tRNA synthetase